MSKTQAKIKEIINYYKQYDIEVVSAYKSEYTAEENYARNSIVSYRLKLEGVMTYTFTTSSAEMGSMEIFVIINMFDNKSLPQVIDKLLATIDLPLHRTYTKTSVEKPLQEFADLEFVSQDMFMGGYEKKMYMKRFANKFSWQKHVGRKREFIKTGGFKESPIEYPANIAVVARSRDELIDIVNSRVTQHSKLLEDTLDLTNVDVSNVTDFSLEDTLDLTNVDVSNVTDFSKVFFQSYIEAGHTSTHPFFGKEYRVDISNWDTSNATTMHAMFYGMKSIVNISNWDVSNVTDMSFMFPESTFNGDISNWDVSNVTTMASMFPVTRLECNLSKWNVSSVTNMAYMFVRAIVHSDISKWSVSNVIKMNDMFAQATFSSDISDWDVSNVDDMSWMFKDCILDCDLSNWNVSDDTNMENMFLRTQMTNNIPAWFKNTTV